MAEPIDDFITALRAAKREFPTLRVSLLIQAAIDHSKRSINFNLNDLSDKQLVTAMKDYKTVLKNKDPDFVRAQRKKT